MKRVVLALFLFLFLSFSNGQVANTEEDNKVEKSGSKEDENNSAEKSDAGKNDNKPERKPMKKGVLISILVVGAVIRAMAGSPNSR